MVPFQLVPNSQIILNIPFAFLLFASAVSCSGQEGGETEAAFSDAPILVEEKYITKLSCESGPTRVGISQLALDVSPSSGFQMNINGILSQYESPVGGAESPLEAAFVKIQTNQSDNATTTTYDYVVNFKGQTGGSSPVNSTLVITEVTNTPPCPRCSVVKSYTAKLDSQRGLFKCRWVTTDAVGLNEL